MDAWPPAAAGDARRTYDPAQHAGGDSTLIRMFEADTPPPRARPPPIATPPSPERKASPQIPTLESPTGLGAARAARRRVVMARLRYAATCDPSRDLDEAEATDAHCVAKRAQADLEALAAARRA